MRKNKPGSYRPISLIPILIKIIECCIKTQLCNYFAEQNLFSSSLFGFRPGLSTINAVETLVTDILDGFENNSITCAVLLDLSKAFDTISHEILINKLECYGVKNNELALIRSYLTNRTQVIIVNSQQSNALPVSIIYADDTTLITSDNKLEEVKKNKKQIHTLPSRTDVHSHDTRYKNNLDVDFTRLSKVQSSFKQTGLKLYNKLPPSLKDLQGDAFRKQLHKLLADKCIYDVKELKCSRDFQILHSLSNVMSKQSISTNVG
ncbi:uncharacterized protein LOC126184449 [Schistocerca cancellata]|uniref:uncharacterized protein LOC126184449 n=1 Tax=Schistocerca cancellata TaxID=274614 RepID=UPI0021178F8D|nr:uncharacterized protein LOC126184449 [Schistocerca cancellata]